MKKSGMSLEVITPDKKIFEGIVTLVQVPGTNGSFEILKNHAPIISTLTPGKVRILDDDLEQSFLYITGGVIEVKKNEIIILAESVENID